MNVSDLLCDLRYIAIIHHIIYMYHNSTVPRQNISVYYCIEHILLHLVNRHEVKHDDSLYKQKYNVKC